LRGKGRGNGEGEGGRGSGKEFRSKSIRLEGMKGNNGQNLKL